MREATIPDATTLRRLLDRAASRRAQVRERSTAYRLLDGAVDGFPGLAVDCYGPWAVISTYHDDAEALVAPVAAQLVGSSARGVYVKRHARGDLRRTERDDVAPAQPIAGEPAPSELTVDENGMRFGVWLADGLSTGLFTDQRDNRKRIRDLCRGVRMLNLFAYTCSFTVAAALGPAVETVSVDLSNRALERGRANLARNGVEPAGHRLLREDALTYLSRAGRRGERFDVIVLDPPSFGTRGRKTFSVERDYAELARLATAVLAPGGRLLAVTNHRKTTSARLQGWLADAVQRSDRHIAQLQVLPPPSDHPDCRDGEPAVKSILVSVD